MRNLRSTMLFCAVAMLPAGVLAEALDETRSVAADATISVNNVAGEIEISTWDNDEVRLTGTLGNNQELEITENAQGIHIEVRQVEDSDEYDESELILVIPAGASVVAVGVSADISITESRGAGISAESVSGDITIEAETGRVELSSVSGDVEFEGTSARTSVETVSGDIGLEGVTGEVTISTVSGDAQLTAGSVSEGNFDTVSGTLDLEMSVADGGRVIVEGMNGDVKLLLPASQSGAFKAQSFSGDISSDFGPVKHQKFGPGSHLKHSTGDSGASIRVETFSGDIHIGHK
jgi:DUF4097 and DUF4098 domain-containing protein YvlB